MKIHFNWFKLFFWINTICYSIFLNHYNVLNNSDDVAMKYKPQKQFILFHRVASEFPVNTLMSFLKL